MSYVYYGTAMTIAVIIAAIVAVAGAVLSMIFIVPEKKRKTLNGFFGMVADLFNFKYLVIEKILKFFYILSTLFAIVFSLFMIFGVGGLSSIPTGLIGVVLFPIIIRLIYEGLMLLVLQVKNTMEINKKLKNMNETPEGDDPFNSLPKFPKKEQPAQQPPQQPVQQQYQPRVIFCGQCGTQYDANRGPCPKCGTKQ